VGLVFVAEMELYDNKRSYCVMLARVFLLTIKLSIPLKFSYLRIVCLRQVFRDFLFGLYRGRHLLRSGCAIELVHRSCKLCFVGASFCRLEREA